LSPAEAGGQVGVDRSPGDAVQRLGKRRTGASAAPVTASTSPAPSAAARRIVWRTTPAGVDEPAQGRKP
jgi:hypothetical protein